MTNSPQVPDWSRIVLHSGILREAVPEKSRLVVWMPGESDGRYRYWSRISTVPHPTIERRDGLCSTAVTSRKARQPIPRFFDFLLQFFRRTAADQMWSLPNGEQAEPCGERQSDLLLVWTEDESLILDEREIKKTWPQSSLMQPVGPRLFLLWGAAPSASVESEAVALPTEDTSREQAEKWLAAARHNGDRQGEASALADLGVLALEQGNNLQSVAYLEDALRLAQSLGDKTREIDILPNLGLATLRIKQSDKAKQYLNRGLEMAREAGDRFADKFALERLATLNAVTGDQPTALRLLDEALAMARSLGDRKHEADLLWHIAIRQAESKQRDLALNYGESAIKLLECLGNPEARVYREHLQKYQQDEYAAGLPDASSIVLSKGAVTAATNNQTTSRVGPGYLRMAISAAKALTRFVGSGMKTVSAETLEKRLQQCAACKHHTGLRCRICGCFTNLKARLPHEQCPAGQWPDLSIR